MMMKTKGKENKIILNEIQIQFFIMLERVEEQIFDVLLLAENRRRILKNLYIKYVCEIYVHMKESQNDER